MRLELDRAARRVRGGTPGLLGGAPVRWFRLTAAGDAALDDLLAPDGPPDSSGRSDGSVTALVERLVDAGALHPRPGPTDAPVPPSTGLTVVVPVRDRPGPLDALLGSLASSDARGAEVVVVDDGSVDPAATAAVAAAHGARLVRREVAGGPAAARGTGLDEVRTPVVAFVDSDCTVTPQWWAPLAAHLGAPHEVLPRVDLVAPRVAAAAGPGLLTAHDARRSPLDLGPDPARVAPGTPVSYVPAAAVAGRTDVLRALGGFDPSMRVGEDVDLVWRAVAAGHRVRYEPSSVVHHPTRPGLAAWCRQRRDYGSSAAPLDRRHPGQVAPVVCSPWSLAVWGAALAGPRRAGPAVAASVAVGTAVAAERRLAAAGAPAGTGAQLALRGHLGAGRQLARATVRVWWPVALATLPASRRARRAVAVAVGVVAVDAARQLRRPALVPLALADDVAYGAGVWAGCARERSVRALLPALAGRRALRPR